MDTAALSEEPVPGEGGAKQEGGRGSSLGTGERTEVRLFVVVALVAESDVNE